MGMRLKGKIALVTGSSKGIGRAIAIAYAKEGAKVIVDYHTSAQEGEETVRLIEKNGGEAILIEADVSKEDEVKVLFAKIMEHFGTLDILVNSAGIARRAPFLEVTLEQWNEVLANNLTSMFLCSKEAAKIMLPKKSGRIINMGSVRGQCAGGNPNALAYSVAKAGINGLTTTLAKELAPYITVNEVAPSFIDTDLAKGWSEKTREEAMSAYIGRLVSAEEVADAFVYFATDAAAATTGQILAVDGGYLLK